MLGSDARREQVSDYIVFSFFLLWGAGQAIDLFIDGWTVLASTHLLAASPPLARSGADVQNAVRTLLCAAAAPTIRGFIYRNVEQDLALARNIYPRDETFKTLFAAAKVKTSAEWCTATTTRPAVGLGTEWYLKVRDFLYRAALN